MRIQYLSASGELGGAEVCLLDMMASLKQEKPDWTLALIAANDGPLLRKAAALGVQTEVLAFPPALSRLGDSKPSGGLLARGTLAIKLAGSFYVARKYSRKLSSRIQDFAPDLLHSNSLKMHVLGAWAKSNDVPLIWHLHDYVSSRWFMSKALRFQRDRCAAVLANSNSVRDDARSVFGDGPEVTTLYNAIDVDEFSPDGPVADLDAMCGLQQPAAPMVRVGLVATMAWWKGHRDFLQALATLSKSQGARVRGYIIGGALYDSEGSQESIADLRQLAAQLGLEGRVGFTGFVDKPSDAIRALDIVVHASTRPEPFGRVIVEAMACAKPAITTGAGGAAELVTCGQDALTFRMGDPADLAERIGELARNAALWRQLGAAGRKTVLEKFDRRRLGRQLADVYERLSGTMVS
ncbi:MAG TPA: glycosyltransferase family 4 protein [Verrucomicrobiae bacterium]|jgi:glycosyltransferase involved in cell wall biosynthesis|nr:glycosyltransferase family 4 protein [Verrucomicrobiae bacterium]